MKKKQNLFFKGLEVLLKKNDDVLKEKYPILKYRLVVQDPPETVESVYQHHVLMGMNENDIQTEIKQ
jgi:hypothetical protein